MGKLRFGGGTLLALTFAALLLTAHSAFSADDSGIVRDGIDTQDNTRDGIDTQGNTREGIDKSGIVKDGIDRRHDNSGITDEGIDHGDLDDDTERPESPDKGSD